MKLEPLQSRRLFAAISFINGTWNIEGTSGPENLYVTNGPADTVRILDNGVEVASRPASAVKKIVFNGNAGNDTFVINGFLSPIHTLAHGGDGDDNINTGEGNDSLFGDVGNDQLTGNAGKDMIDGGVGNDVTTGGTDNDTLLGGDGDDLMNGGFGNDLLDGGFGADRFRGGVGSDTGTYASRTNAVYVDINPNPDNTPDDGEELEGDNFELDMENVIGGAGDDVLVGTITPEKPVTIFGFTLNNILRGNGGNDVLVGLDGNDVLDGGLGADALSGGDGNDTADYSTRKENLTLDLDGFVNDGAADEGDGIDSDVETLIGGSGNDRITGNDVANALFSNSGNDVIDGGLGADVMSGGAGRDTVSYASRTESLVLNLDGKPNDGAANEKDKIGADFENITGGNGADTITGNGGENYLRGLGGSDFIYGGAGNDTLLGDSGTDRLFGEAGNDLIYANSTTAARDIVDGGRGTDRARFDVGVDTVKGIETILS